MNQQLNLILGSVVAIRVEPSRGSIVRLAITGDSPVGPWTVNLHYSADEIKDLITELQQAAAQAGGEKQVLEATP
jgi:hypothetical protein